MTNRQHMIALLQSPEDRTTIRYFNSEFGCSHIPSEECEKQDICFACWKHWLESEARSDGE